MYLKFVDGRNNIYMIKAGADIIMNKIKSAWHTFDNAIKMPKLTESALCMRQRGSYVTERPSICRVWPFGLLQFYLKNLKPISKSNKQRTYAKSAPCMPARPVFIRTCIYTRNKIKCEH